MNNPLFLISLDFELHWGSFDKHPLTKSRKRYYLNTRESIIQSLLLFKQYQIHATWAVVGLLFYQTKKELLAHLPEKQPSYHNKKLSAYPYLENNNLGENEEEDPFHFAHSLIQEIKQTPHQDIGTHSFAHFYCNEPGQSPGEFEADLEAAVNAAGKLGINMKSMVFPRNQFNEQYLKVCREKGITAVRSNPADWWWKITSTQNESKFKRISRGLDAYIKLGGKTSYPLSSISTGELPVCIPASRLLRPYNPSEGFLNNWKINRIKKEMTTAAKNNEVYHLWWHPHNFGNWPEKNLAGLKSILEHYKKLSSQYNMKSYNMRELIEKILAKESQSA